MSTAVPVPEVRRGDDPLMAIPPDVYVRRLLGVEVPRPRKVPCPFHDDRHASLHVYETAPRGWYCFGRCRRRGTIYDDLAAPLYSYDARRDDFVRLRGELRRLFGLDGVRCARAPVDELRVRRDRHPARHDDPRLAGTPSS